MRIRISAAFVAIGLLAASCSSSKLDSSSTTSKAGGATTVPKTQTTTGVTDTEIKVSGLGYQASYSEGLIGAQARFKRQNDAGGVDGRKIVEQDQPFAVVPVLTATFPAADYLNKQGVPFLGWGIVPDWCHKQAGFSLTGCTDPSVNTQISDFGPTLAKAFPDGTIKGKTVALIGADTDSARLALKSFGDVWKFNGAKVVSSNASIPLPPAVVADYTPYAQTIMSSNGGKGPDLVEAISSITDGIGIATKLRQLGYTKPIVEFSLYDPRIVALSKNVYNELTFAPWEETSNPAVQQMIKDVNAINPTATKGLAMEAGYWSADLFIAILKKVGRNLTRERFIAAANADFHYDGQNTTADLSFPTDHTESAAGLALVLGVGDKYVVTSPFTDAKYYPKATIEKGAGG